MKSGLRNVILASLLLLIFVVSIYAILSFYTRIPSKGKIKLIGIRAFWDANCTREVTEIDWGYVDPGRSYSNTIYLYNDGNFPVTLTLSTENWSPEVAANYLSLVWDYNGSTIAPKTVLPVTLTLTVDPSVTGIENFSFYIVIVASEA